MVGGAVVVGEGVVVGVVSGAVAELHPPTRTPRATTAAVAVFTRRRMATIVPNCTDHRPALRAAREDRLGTIHAHGR